MVEEIKGFELTGFSLVGSCPHCGTSDWDTPCEKRDGTVCHHPTVVTSIDRARMGPRYFVGDGAAYWNNWKSRYRHGSGSAWVTFVIEWDEECGHFVADLYCDGPHPDHWLAYNIDAIGIDGLLGFGDTVEQQLSWMLSRGVAPGQRFMVEMEFAAWTDYWGEHDEDLGFSIIDVEPWTDEQILSAWEEALRHAEVQA